MKLGNSSNHVCVKNIECLSIRYPKLLQTINVHTDKNLSSKIINSKDGNKSLILEDQGRKIYVNSKYRPIEEARKWSDFFKFKYDTIVIVFGFGIGYRLKELAAILPDNNQLIVIEPNTDVFVSAIKNVDIRDIISKENIHLAVGKTIEECKNILNKYINWINYDDIIVRPIPNYEKIFANEYNLLLKFLQEIRTRKISDRNTMLFFSRVWQKNQIMNLPYMLQSSYIKDLSGVFKNRPAIIVSAGPSLNKNVELLREVKDKILIICVGTALRVLLRADIKPDIVITIDGGEANYNHFKGISYDDITLVYVPRTNPEILNKHEGNKILSVSFDNHITNLFNRFGKDIGFIKSGGSVSNCAMDLAVKLGANPIIFIGQDLAYTNNTPYAEGTIYEKQTIDAIENIEGESNKIYVEDINGKPVLTSSEWHKFLKWFEDEIERDTSDRLYIDATEGGARIKGTTLIKLREVIDRYATENINIHDKICIAINSQPRFSTDEISDILKQYKLVVESLVNIKEICIKGENLESQLCNIYEKKDIIDTATKNSIIKELNMIDSFILSRKEIFDSLEFIIEPVLVNFSKLEDEKNCNTDEIDLLQRRLMFYRELKDVIIYIKPFLNTCIENLERIILEN
ncbi:motility associated factor glycosyltransferase family protein [Wukongibacter sp. M2B1]|uniref:motility associated factor glycosyltransferase family protein n=1 Tax=Wukongibacter sp. M2B1 TaxID=3088895 RepID=UPI003D7A6F6F